MKNTWIYALMACLLTACSHSVKLPEVLDCTPEIYPDYVGVTVPVTIAPMNFDYQGEDINRIDVVVTGGKSGTIHVNDKRVSFPPKKWRRLLAENQGDSLLFQVSVKQGKKWKQYQPFSMYVSDYSIDYGLVYRKIAPGYELYSTMGLYERDLSTFKEKPLLENTIVSGMSVNDQALNQANPNRLSLHVRGGRESTLMQVNGKMQLLNTETDSVMSTFVHPYWHPSGNYIAYSATNAHYSFPAARGKQAEVCGTASDVLVYHPENHEVLLSPLLQQEDVFRTFPAFSADGRTLYFCSSGKKELPLAYKDVQYNLCSIDFDPDRGTFGDRVDTLVNAVAMGKSVSFPRPSYDGRYLMFTLSNYGNFPIWHEEADLWLLDLADHSLRPLSEVNSEEAEGSHNWSSNSHWFVFSSSREDGLYTRLYLACVDKEGRVSKPFLLPQESPAAYYDYSIYSYTTPEFTTIPIKLNFRRAERRIVSNRRVQVEVRKME